MREYVRLRFHRRRAIVLERLGGKCVVCGSTSDIQIDHRDPSIKMSSWTLAGMSQSKLETEIIKCQLLCQPHHIEKTVTERGQNLARGTHGTLSSRRYCGPPSCGKCRKAHREYEQRRKNGGLTNQPKA